MRAIPMSELSFYLNEAREGNSEAAYFGLIHLGDVVGLQDAYRAETDPKIRALLVHAVWQHRLSETIGFLAVALRDPHGETWKEALGGLVTLASPASRKVVEDELARTAESNPDYRNWLEEAIEQIDAAIGTD
jgi:hypothetical protein